MTRSPKRRPPPQAAQAADIAELLPFAGFGPRAMQFLRDVAENQDRTWMAANKPIYEAEIRRPLAALVTDLSQRLAGSGTPLWGDPDRALFRLNRDVRFSPDKRPYKTHASAVLSRDGGKRAPGLLYIHLDPAGSFAAAGFFRPEPGLLGEMRAELLRRPAAWAKLGKALAAENLHLQRDDTLVRPPKGFDAIPPALQTDIRLKTWIVTQALPPPLTAQAGLVDELAGFAARAAPLLRFGWAAVDRDTGG